MPLRLLSLLFAIAVFVVFGSLRLHSRLEERSATISARELLSRTQRASAASYTFDRSTSAALSSVQVPVPPATADQQALESALRGAGFGLRPLDVPGKKMFRVESTGG